MTYIKTTKRQLLIGAAMMGAMLLPSHKAQAMAAICTNCATVASQIGSYASQIKSEAFKQSSAIKSQTKVLELAINQAASSISQEVNASNIRTITAMDDLYLALAQSQQKAEAARAANEARDQYGISGQSITINGVTHQATAIPTNICEASGRASGIGASREFGKFVQRESYNDVSKHNNSYANNNEARDRYKELEDDALDLKFLDGDMTGLTMEESDKADEWIKAATNPFPAPELSESAKLTPAGEEYEVTKRILQAKLAPSQQALTMIKADTVMSVPVKEDIQEKWDAIDPEAEMPSENGMVSPLMVLATEVDYRYASQEGVEKLIDLKPKGSLTELLVMKSIELKIQLEQYKLERMRTMMMAMESASHARDGLEEDLDTLYEAVRSATDGGKGRGILNPDGELEQ